MEPWMLPGMAELQAGQYKVDPAKAEARLRTWFDSDFAHRQGSIALAGISGDRVIAMQTYSAWPYVRNGRSYRSLQSGATLVHPDFRGRKIFQRLLREGNRLATANGHDFLVGFPVPMSLGGFVKDGWTNHGPLRWWTRALRPLALLQRKAPTSTLELPRCPGETFYPESVAPTEGRGGMFSLTDEPDFFQWRYSHRAEDFRYFRHSRGTHSVHMILKPSTQHGFKEILIGKVRSRRGSSAFVGQALLRLGWTAYRNGAAAISTALLNPEPTTLAALILAGFLPGKATAPLIVKPLHEMPDVTNKKFWRGTCLEDIDTW